MSSDVIVLAHRVLQALSARAWDELVALSDPDVEWESFFAVLREGGTYRGHDGMRQYIDDLNDAFDIINAVPESAVAAGDVVVLAGHIHYRGKGSGFETQTPAGWMLKFRDGKVVHFRAFRDPDQVLESAGR